MIRFVTLLAVFFAGALTIGDGSADEISSLMGLKAASLKVRLRAFAFVIDMVTSLAVFFVVMAHFEDFFVELWELFFVVGNSGTTSVAPEDRVLLATGLSGDLAPGSFVPNGGLGSGEGALSLLFRICRSLDTFVLFVAALFLITALEIPFVDFRCPTSGPPSPRGICSKEASGLMLFILLVFTADLEEAFANLRAGVIARFVEALLVSLLAAGVDFVGVRRIVSRFSRSK